MKRKRQERRMRRRSTSREAGLEPRKEKTKAVYLKVGVDVTQLRYSLLKSLHLHGGLEVLRSH